MALVVWVAAYSRIPYLLFPELAAVSFDVLTRPSGKWAREPFKLAAAPVITAVIGILVAAWVPYGVVSLLVMTLVSLGVILAWRSAMSPAISAGLLPIALGETSWRYPVCILGTLGSLACLLLVWKSTAFGRELSPRHDAGEVIEVLESQPKGKWWFPSLLLFVAVLAGAAQLSGWRFILFPPLVVMAYEMLGHTDTCPWSKAPFTFPVVCTLSAFVGLACLRWIPIAPASAVLVLAFALMSLQVSRLRLPPALAIGLIPFILPSPSWRFGASVAIGTCALTVWFLIHRRLVRSPAQLSC